MTVQIYAEGLVCCSVCVPSEMTRADVEAAVNEFRPSGTESGWHISEDAAFKDGEPNPCQCDQDSGRLHYLLNC